MANYYIYVAGEVGGPYSLSEIENRLNAGEIFRETPVCEAGKDQWVEASLLFGLVYVRKSEPMIEKFTRDMTQKTVRVMRRMLKHHGGFKGFVVVPKDKMPSFTVEPAPPRFSENVVQDTAAARLARAKTTIQPKEKRLGVIASLFRVVRNFFTGIIGIFHQFFSLLVQKF